MNQQQQRQNFQDEEAGADEPQQQERWADIVDSDEEEGGTRNYAPLPLAAAGSSSSRPRQRGGADNNGQSYSSGRADCSMGGADYVVPDNRRSGGFRGSGGRGGHHRGRAGSRDSLTAIWGEGAGNSSSGSSLRMGGGQRSRGDPFNSSSSRGNNGGLPVRPTRPKLVVSAILGNLGGTDDNSKGAARNLSIFGSGKPREEPAAPVAPAAAGPTSAAQSVEVSTVQKPLETASPCAAAATAAVDQQRQSPFTATAPHAPSAEQYSAATTVPYHQSDGGGPSARSMSPTAPVQQQHGFPHHISPPHMYPLECGGSPSQTVGRPLHPPPQQPVYIQCYPQGGGNPPAAMMYLAAAPAPNVGQHPHYIDCTAAGAAYPSSPVPVSAGGAAATAAVPTFIPSWAPSYPDPLPAAGSRTEISTAPPSSGLHPPSLTESAVGDKRRSRRLRLENRPLQYNSSETPAVEVPPPPLQQQQQQQQPDPQAQLEKPAMSPATAAASSVATADNCATRENAAQTIRSDGSRSYHDQSRGRGRTPGGSGGMQRKQRGDDPPFNHSRSSGGSRDNLLINSNFSSSNRDITGFTPKRGGSGRFSRHGGRKGNADGATATSSGGLSSAGSSSFRPSSTFSNSTTTRKDGTVPLSNKFAALMEDIE